MLSVMVGSCDVRLAEGAAQSLARQVLCRDNASLVSIASLSGLSLLPSSSDVIMTPLLQPAAASSLARLLGSSPNSTSLPVRRAFGTLVEAYLLWWQGERGRCGRVKKRDFFFFFLFFFFFKEKKKSRVPFPLAVKTFGFEAGVAIEVAAGGGWESKFSAAGWRVNSPKNGFFVAEFSQTATIRDVGMLQIATWQLWQSAVAVTGIFDAATQLALELSPVAPVWNPRFCGSVTEGLQRDAQGELALVIAVPTGVALVFLALVSVCTIQKKKECVVVFCLCLNVSFTKTRHSVVEWPWTSCSSWKQQSRAC
jgi:hypothetical protein